MTTDVRAAKRTVAELPIGPGTVGMIRTLMIFSAPADSDPRDQLRTLSAISACGKVPVKRAPRGIRSSTTIESTVVVPLL